MAHNKVIFGNTTLIDLSSATATAADIKKGKTAWDKNGNLITGTYEEQIVTRTTYSENITSGTKYTKQLTDYNQSTSWVDAFINGLALQDSEFTVSAAGLFSLVNTLTGTGNTIKVIHWKQGS